MFPVSTGLNRDNDCPTATALRVPRIHGAEPTYIAATVEGVMCSPYPRG